jgi:hypothetical protein
MSLSQLGLEIVLERRVERDSHEEWLTKNTGPRVARDASADCSHRDAL